MKAAIIAAGKGERLVQSGITVPKPLVCIHGEPMIARVIRAAANLEVVSVACIVNDLNPDVAEYIRSGSWAVPVELLVKTTPSSMESLFALSSSLSDEPFLLFTVDTIFRSGILKSFLDQAQSLPTAQGVLALTQFVDDEKPLWVRVDNDYKINAMGDAAQPTPFITAGFYYFTPAIFELIDAARARQFSALRQFLGLLTERGYPLYGVPVSKTIDVDYPQDIEKADLFLKEIDG